ncbi:MAG: hypothetical protein ABI297_02565 [Ginsengibacter sp.]
MQQRKVITRYKFLVYTVILLLMLTETRRVLLLDIYSNAVDGGEPIKKYSILGWSGSIIN